MSKIPSELGVKFTVSDISMEVPKPLFESAAIKVAVFFGRKGKAALTRRTKWFTIADPSTVGSSTRQMVALPPEGELGNSRRGSTTRTGVDSNENSVHQVTGELAVLEFGALNNVVYDTELKPLNKFDGEWVFDQKLTHPVTVFAKVFIKMRPGAKANVAKSEQESNLNEILQMDQSELDDDDFSSGDEHDGAADANNEPLDMEGVHLTTEQLSLLTDGKSENEILLEQLKSEIDCKRRYLAFPKTIDLGAVANTRAKTLEFSERVSSKSASLLGSVISFKIHADIDEGTLAKYEEKKKGKEDKEERKRREKEEKILEKERKKQEKAEAKEKKKNKGKEEEAYGADVTNTDGNGAATTTEASKSKAPDSAADKPKSSFSPFSKIKSIFAGKEKVQNTPFPIKYEHTPYPYLFLLDKFVLHKLTMPPEFYRAIHIRLGCDAAVLDGFPMMLLNTDSQKFLKEADVPGYDGQPKHIFKFDFGNSHIYFADKHIRNITGFETIRALTEHEKSYATAKKHAAEGVEGEGRQESHELFRAEILNVGEKFQPMTFQATRFSAHEAQVEPTKYTRVVAQLVVPKKVENLTITTDEEEKANYLKKIKKEQKEKEKAEKDAVRQEKKEEKKRQKAAKKAAKKAGGAESSEDDSDDSSSDDDDDDGSNSVPDTATEHGSPNEAGQEKKPEDDEEAQKVDEEEAQKVDEEEAKKEEAQEDDEAKKEEAKEGEAKSEGEGSEEVKETAFESEGADEQPKAAKEPKEPKASKESRYSVNKTSSFQLGLQLINEENVPADGVMYSIRFVTGEELTFRARRIFLPSVCAYGDSGASKTDVPLLQFTPNA